MTKRNWSWVGFNVACYIAVALWAAYGIVAVVELVRYYLVPT
jgi:hypothetical protein